ncbi:hypothetical protein KUV75_00795 [Qipengyuania gaetbuli]|uniref:hypothetical protein n=1 Tax=Qipengyuania gaetbuli TaxID=266952 RepID=UPI001C98ED33|nr:hypothetical protein [Qipengyuania gaetbuli]MBY6013443.1 hypothetical protein [Qipengyuania gaetbuli]
MPEGRASRLQRLANSVVVIEHNLDVIKTADHILDLGPGGGVTVASGDVTNNGTADASGSGRTDAGDYTVWRDAPGAASAAPGDVAAPGPRPQAASLLLPAVQKVREAAAARPSGMACEVGATLRNLTIRNEETAQVVRVPVATVTACSAKQVTLNFSKLEAMDPAERPRRARTRE